MNNLIAGAAQQDISPEDSQFLCGYPHVERYSTGIHDKLWSSALYLSNTQDNSEVMFIANDILYLSRDMTAYVRNLIHAQTGVRPECIMVTSTHTHSGPKTLNNPINKDDPAVPNVDDSYVNYILPKIAKAGIDAYENAREAKIGSATADAGGVGTNRRDPEGPSDLEVPILLVRGLDDKNIACMQVCCMHPTVMHEDSTLVSGDFPGMARIYLKENVLGENCPVLHHTGPAGNQSPRHVTKGNTFEEAERLGNILGRAVEKAIENVEFSTSVQLQTSRVLLDNVPKRHFPSVEEAEKKLENAINKLESLRQSNAPKPEVRTAECDWFGAEKTLTLAKAAADGSLEKSRNRCLPAEIQLIKVGDRNYVGWPGEVFIEYELEVKKQCPNTSIMAYSNGVLNGYIVTKEAYEEGGYEASSAQFSWETGNLLVEKTLELVKETQ